jgi:hypothetical protein
MSVNPLGATNAAMGSGTSSNQRPDAAEHLGFNAAGSSLDQVESRLPPRRTGVDPSMYGGDPNDPAYGSFTKPFDVEQFYNYADPGYAFELQQGTQSLQNAASAGSGAFSGRCFKDLLGYSQGFARTGYNDAFNRYQTQQGNIFSRLSDIAHLGQNAAAGVGAQGTQLAGNAGQFTSNAGSAAGAGIVGAGNAASNGLTNYWLMSQLNKPPSPPAARAVCDGRARRPSGPAAGHDGEDLAAAHHPWAAGAGPARAADRAAARGDREVRLEQAHRRGRHDRHRVGGERSELQGIAGDSYIDLMSTSRRRSSSSSPRSRRSSDCAPSSARRSPRWSAACARTRTSPRTTTPAARR